ncbi:hypothetical protein niasHT_024813 [Heterodera trifolii]|uniref:Uncharacterized protein n=1 Tax=Heterodera trifolii TaxID=157864 RepID=A0ABD2KG91_9BILA
MSHCTTVSDHSFTIKGFDVKGCKIEELASIDDDEQRTIFGLILRFRGRHGEELEGTPMPDDSVYFAQRPAAPHICLRTGQTKWWRTRCCRSRASNSVFLFATEGPNERVENAVLPVEPSALPTLEGLDKDIFVKKKEEEGQQLRVFVCGGGAKRARGECGVARGIQRFGHF